MADMKGRQSYFNTYSSTSPSHYDNSSATSFYKHLNTEYSAKTSIESKNTNKGTNYSSSSFSKNKKVPNMTIDTETSNPYLQTELTPNPNSRNFNGNQLISSFAGLSLSLQHLKQTKNMKNKIGLSFGNTHTQDAFDILKNYIPANANPKNTKYKNNFAYNFNGLTSPSSSIINETQKIVYTPKNVPKVQREINYLSRVFSKDKKTLSLINRPALKLETKPDLDFSPRKYLDASPTNIKKKFLITSSVAKVNPRELHKKETQTLNNLEIKSPCNGQSKNSFQNKDLDNFFSDFENKKKQISKVNNTKKF